MRLASDIIEVDSLDRAQRDAMFALMQRCYEGTHRESFENDLAAKRWVLQVREPATGRLVGFSTQVLLEAEVAGEKQVALFSGDTVVEPESWGDNALASAWGNFVLPLIDQHSGNLSWFLTSKGFRTYRYLPLFFRHFAPRHDRTIPARERELIHAFGQLVSPRNYDATRGIIRHTSGKERVRASLATPRDRARHDPHVRFFLEANSGHELGDELCCLAPLTRENFTRAALRVIGALPAERAVAEIMP